MIKIVLVEDHQMFREGIKVIIDQIPDLNMIAEFENGKQLLEQMPNLDFDVLVTDIEMPEMSGIDLTKIVCSNYPNIKVMALSMYNDNKYYYELITAGAKGFVLKQSSVDELEKGIREVYAGNSFFSEKLLYNVIQNMQHIEKNLLDEKLNLLQLTDKEVSLLRHICQGFANKEIADKMFLSIKTIESNKARLMRKTNTKNNAGLIIWAVKNKIIEL